MGDFRYLANSIDDGDFFNGSMLKEFTAHAGMHHALPTSSPSSFRLLCLYITSIEPLFDFNRKICIIQVI